MNNLYTVKKLDRRFKLHCEAGFEYMLEWPPCDYDYRPGSIYHNYRQTARLVELRLGRQYFKHAQPDGRWCERQDRVGKRWTENQTRHRIFIRTAKHLTLVQLG